MDSLAYNAALGLDSFDLQHHAFNTCDGFMKAGQNEYKIQAEFIRYLELIYPDLLYTISPAGFIASAGMAMKMMRMGYRKGTPDVMIFEPRGSWHGMLIEFKDPKGIISEAQQKFLTQASAKGYYCVVCRSSADAISYLNSYIKEKL